MVRGRAGTGAADRAAEPEQGRCVATTPVHLRGSKRAGARARATLDSTAWATMLAQQQASAPRATRAQLGAATVGRTRKLAAQMASGRTRCASVRVLALKTRCNRATCTGRKRALRAAPGAPVRAHPRRCARRTRPNAPETGCRRAMRAASGAAHGRARRALVLEELARARLRVSRTRAARLAERE
jgi:hypothetical protein